METPINPLNTQFLEEMYSQWQKNPGSVSKEWQDYFSSLGKDAEIPDQKAPIQEDFHYKQGRVDSLIWGYRDVGYLYADLNPLKGYMPKELEYIYYSIQGNYESLSLKEFGLSESDMGTVFSTGRFLQPSKAPLSRLIELLKSTYCSYLGVEILHIQNKPIRTWLIRKIETDKNIPNLSSEQKIRTQKDLIKSLEFENFLHRKFVGQKRFSLEGAEVLIPGLHYLIDTAAAGGIEEIVLGMSHRGRLNTLTNIMGKPAEQIFSKFEDKDESPTFGESGDVRYHLGYSRDHINKDGSKVHISLVANPSHLESVDPVVQGKTRGIQRRRGDKGRKKVIPVLIHGDAAFSGQGIVAETFNLSKLRGYETGGTIHIIVNNQIGFTTASRDLRSTFFPTDIAKSMPVPIFHVNGDKPEYVIRAINLAFQFRQKFGYDAIVDILCYRKFGHNEGDDPSFTHPKMYNLIKQSPGVTTLYGAELKDAGVFSQEEQDEYRKEYISALNNYFKKAKLREERESGDGFKEGEWLNFSRAYSHDPVSTGVKKSVLNDISEKCTAIPDNFTAHKKLERIIEGRRKQLEEGTGIDWATGEMLAFGSLLVEGIPIRLSGEDSGRGTFSHRHGIWWDISSIEPKSYIPLNHISPEQARFSVYDSPLSEFAVLGFEFGNSLAQPKMLCIWEAQFGDFCNGAQVIIDQFISASEVKWDRSSGLVMLLPHGYEGQGPEHSNGFLERFLQLCAQDNIQVVNCTTPVQYFHLLRRQMKRDFRKPCIVMSPKSLLRNKLAVSAITEFTMGTFQEIIDDPKGDESAEILLGCSGKIYYELAEKKVNEGHKGFSIIRMEQLYPFPTNQLKKVLTKYPGAKEFRWVQEEPINRGPWNFILQRLSGSIPLTLSCISRPESASPACGSYNQHIREQNRVLTGAFSKENL